MSTLDSTIQIESLDPLVLSFPPGATELAGTLLLQLPPLRVKWVDLGGVVPGACLASQGRLLGWEIALPEPVSIGTIADVIARCAPDLALAHRVAQEELDKRCLLDELPANDDPDTAKETP